jgi:pilus assembly protein CpaC
MQSRTELQALLLACLLALLPQQGRAAVAPAPGPSRDEPPMAELMPPPPTKHVSVVLEAGTGKVLTLPAPAANVFVVDPKVTEVRPASATNLFMFGIAAGHTTVEAMDANGHAVAEFDVIVRPSLFAAKEAEAAIARLIQGGHVRVDTQPRGLLLTGSVRTPGDATAVLSVVKGFTTEGQTIDNQLSIDSPIQVTLNVRVAEMSRNVVRKLGVNWQAIATIGSIAHAPALAASVNGGGLTCAGGGATSIGCQGVNFNAVIDALAQDNLAHVLAEPNLTVMSGQPASFQVGGEYPIPVSQQNNQVTVAYKNYGVLLTFVPTVYSDGRINLHVRPEVSQISSENGVSLAGNGSTLFIPSLKVRRAETTVELGSGQSFAIAGMLQQTTNDSPQSVPGLGDTPLIGALFRDTNFNRTETELVIVVTPYIVRPVNDLSALHLPTDGYAPPPDIERLLVMRQVATTRSPVPVRLPGDAGFVVQ